MTFFQRLRRFRSVGVALFIAIVLLVSAERRVAEAHFNARAACTAVGNQDALDADEIRTRLIALNDQKVPILPQVATAVSAVFTAWRTHLALLVLDASGPRGPPARRSSSA